MFAFMAAGFLAVLVTGIAATLVMMRGQDQTSWIKHTFEVERHVGMIRLSLEEMRSARRGAALGIRSDSGATYEEARNRFLAEVNRVAASTVDNPNQQKNILELRLLYHRLDGLLRNSLHATKLGTMADEAARQSAARAVQDLTGRMLAEERRLLAQRDRDQKSSVTTFYSVLGVAALLLAFVAVGSLLVIRRYTHHLAVSRNTLRKLNDNLEGAVRERTTDLQRANDEIQRFAYIVSHDLRSPLVNVMGFTAELDASIKPLAQLLDQAEEHAPDIVSEEARYAVRDDLPEAIGFIRTSTQKMDRLINAILRLSREGRRTITPERLDLDAIANSAVDALRYRIDELGVEVHVTPNMPEIVSDRLAVEQILSNLVENAVKYLKPGRPGVVQIGGYKRYGRVMIEVSDNGRGIEVRDHDRIFDLFRRSGAQDQPGEGIGLAHVRALAYRLGGTISVASELDKGATFTINLPIVYMGEKGAAA